ncbi:MAG: UDP-3-O-(3-hydroxymyristoyl)glucosamine N-acyltransferase [Desulfamplus sp.]|nr:UDP-3-O-(3-hydroxymyristoyl)glucosamine N-acyltransferase [Desulfamplus sp.]
MKLTLKEIAHKIDGKVIGDETLEIFGVSSFYDAKKGEITFASDPKFLKALDRTCAGAVIVPDDFDIMLPEEFYGKKDNDNKALEFDKKIIFPLSLIKTQNPKRKFFRILSIFHPSKRPNQTISKDSFIGSNFVHGNNLIIGHHVTIGDNVKIGDNVEIMHGVYIGDDVSIGNNTVIKPNATIMERTQIGSRVIINSGTVIGSDGFGFTQDSSDIEDGFSGNGVNEKIPHAGFVQIDDDVEIGACNTIDRGTLGRTWIQKGVKTDNLVHIAHNVIVGEHSLIVAQVGIAGSTVIGKRVILAGQAGISGHLKIGDGAIVGPAAGVLKDVESGQIVSGVPAMPHKLWLKVASILPKLPDIRKKIMELEKKLTPNN